MTEMTKIVQCLVAKIATIEVCENRSTASIEINLNKGIGSPEIDIEFCHMTPGEMITKSQIASTLSNFPIGRR